MNPRVLAVCRPADRVVLLPEFILLATAMVMMTASVFIDRPRASGARSAPARCLLALSPSRA